MQFSQLKRREFITLLGGATVAWPFASRAEQAERIYRIGFLANDPTIPNQPAGQAFLDGLRENGFVEGQNIVVERRFSDGRVERYDELVKELLQAGVDVIVTSANDATLVAKRLVQTVPIVMMNVYDPVGTGIIASLAHPGGNITGVVQHDSTDIAAKRLQLLRDALPRALRVAVLIDPAESYGRAESNALEIAAPSLRLTLQHYSVHSAAELGVVFEKIGVDGADAVFAVTSSLLFTNRRLITQLAIQARLPLTSAFRETTESGALMSYGSVRTERFRHAAVYVAKILRGAKPADLPVEQPSKYELVINLKTARLLNLDLPRDLLLVADEVIE